MMKDGGYKYGKITFTTLIFHLCKKGKKAEVLYLKIISLYVGWTVSLTEYMDTIPTLWKTAQQFIEKHPEYVIRGDDSLMPWITDDNFISYNGCHFWSNFEVNKTKL